MTKKKFKKNCYNCIHFHHANAVWITCTKRLWAHDKMQEEPYREKAKVCCELKEQNNE